MRTKYPLYIIITEHKKRGIQYVGPAQKEGRQNNDGLRTEYTKPK